MGTYARTVATGHCDGPSTATAKANRTTDSIFFSGHRASLGRYMSRRKSETTAMRAAYEVVRDGHTSRSGSGLAPPTPCRSPGALRVLHAQPRSPVSVRQARIDGPHTLALRHVKTPL